MVTISNKTLFNFYKEIPSHLKDIFQDAKIEDTADLPNIKLNIKGKNLDDFKKTYQHFFGLLDKIADSTYTFTLETDQSEQTFSTLSAFKGELQKLLN